MHVQRSQVWMRKNPSGGGNEKACYLDSWNRVYPILHLFFFFLQQHFMQLLMEDKNLLKNEEFFNADAVFHLK